MDTFKNKSIVIKLIKSVLFWTISVKDMFCFACCYKIMSDTNIWSCPLHINNLFFGELWSLRGLLHLPPVLSADTNTKQLCFLDKGSLSSESGPVLRLRMYGASSTSHHFFNHAGIVAMLLTAFILMVHSKICWGFSHFCSGHIGVHNVTVFTIRWWYLDHVVAFWIFLCIFVFIHFMSFFNYCITN